MATENAWATTAQFCMSSPVCTIPTAATVREAQQKILRIGYTGLCVVDDQGTLTGIVCRRDIEIAIHHGLAQAQISSCMSAPVKTVGLTTPLSTVQTIMTTYSVGRLPVISKDALVGIVTRSDLLRQLSTAQKTAPLLDNELPSSTATGLTAQRLSYQRLPSLSLLYAQLQARIQPIWPALMLLAQASAEQGWALYMVGGAVRDLLLNYLGESYPLTDIDLVVDGAESGAGVTLAALIQAQYPQTRLHSYGEFQTASLTWPISVQENAPAATFSIDIATARTEFYAYPAANPEVAVSTIHQDLYRRDFTINAMALRLHPTQTTQQGSTAKETPDQVQNQDQLLDLRGGWIDLQRAYIRVIHPNSFIEDPTRIFRAVRFAARLGFAIEPHTEQLMRYALNSGLYTQLQKGDHKVPALQSRLTSELKYILSSSQWEAALSELERVGALACIDSELRLSQALWRQLRRMTRWQPKFAAKHPRWLLLLSLLIAQLTPGARDRVVTTLQLDTTSQRRLKSLHQWEANLQQLSVAQRPSQVFQLLRTHNEFELLLIADRHPYTLGPHIWHYIVHLSRMPPLINGATLKRLGYQPGPQFKEILDAVYRRTLDGDLKTAQDASAYVLATYPRSDHS